MVLWLTNCGKLAAGIKPTATLCFVNEQQSNSRLTGARGLLELLTRLGKLGCYDCCGLPLNAPERIFEQAVSCPLEGRAL